MGEEEDKSLDEESLPRIIVEDDRIIVVEDSWLEKNVETLLDRDSYLDQTGQGSEEEAVAVEEVVSSEEGLGEVLEEVVSGAIEKEEEGVAGENFYKVGMKAGDLYDSKMYEEIKGEDSVVDVSEGYDALIGKVEEKRADEVEEGRRRRSMLEISGFRDEEAERRREERRRALWG